MKSLLWINNEGNQRPLISELKEGRINALTTRLGDNFYIIKSPKFLDQEIRNKHIAITKTKTINTTDKGAFGKELATIDLENQIVSYSNFSQYEYIQFQTYYALVLLRACRLLAATNCLRKMLTNTGNMGNAWVNEAIKDINKSPYLRYGLSQHTSIVFKACFNFNHAVKVSRGKDNTVSDFIIITNDWQLQSDTHDVCRLKYCQNGHYLNQLGTSTLIIDVKKKIAFFLGQDETLNLFNLLNNPFFDTLFEPDSDKTEDKKVLDTVATHYKQLNKNMPAMIEKSIVYRVLTKKELQESYQTALNSAQQPLCTPPKAQRNTEQKAGITIFDHAGRTFTLRDSPSDDEREILNSSSTTSFSDQGSGDEEANKYLSTDVTKKTFEHSRKVYKLSEKETLPDPNYEYFDFDYLGIFFKFHKRNIKGPIFEYLVRKNKSKKQPPNHSADRFFKTIPLFSSESSSDDSTEANQATHAMITEIKNATLSENLSHFPPFPSTNQLEKKDTDFLRSSFGDVGDEEKITHPQSSDTPTIIKPTILTEFEAGRVLYRNENVRSVARKAQALLIFKQSKFDLDNIEILKERMLNERDNSKTIGSHLTGQVNFSHAIKYENTYATHVTEDSMVTWPGSDNTLRSAMGNYANIDEKINTINAELKKKYKLQIIPTQYDHQNLLHAISPTGALTTSAVEALHNAFVDEYLHFYKLSKVTSDLIKIPDDNNSITSPIHCYYVELIRVNLYRDKQSFFDNFHPSDILQLMQNPDNIELFPPSTDNSWLIDWGIKKLTLIARILCKHIVVFTIPDENSHKNSKPFNIDYIDPTGLWLFNIEQETIKILSCIRKLKVEPERILFIFYYKNKERADLNGRFFAIELIERLK